MYFGSVWEIFVRQVSMVYTVQCTGDHNFTATGNFPLSNEQGLHELSFQKTVLWNNWHCMALHLNSKLTNLAYGGTSSMIGPGELRNFIFLGPI